MLASRPLSCLPFSTLARSYIITAVSSYPLLLRPSLFVLTFLAHATSPIFNPDRNPVLRYALKKTFYAQFCAGETADEVHKTIAGLKRMGYKGVILGHAKEVVLTEEEVDGLDASKDTAEQARANAADIALWKQNTVDTIALADQDDFVALKFTGAGGQALQRLKATVACAPEFEAAVHEICRRAQDKGVRLLFDAEQASLQQGIDNWTMYFAKIYNKGEKAVVYGTYQAYAKRTPKILAQHLEQARKENFVLGVKLVRGAYMGSDPRELFWPTIDGTHHCYNGLAQCLIGRRFGGILVPVEGASSQFPRVDLVLASHNAETVRLARQLRDLQVRNGEPRIEMAYAQLMGMADNVSCELVQAARERAASGRRDGEVPNAYKYLVWGRMSECMKYLLRRAQENRDAVMRTVDARRALGQELGSRMRLFK